MATTASLPPYLLPGVPVHQPTHLEGDPTLATEILPGPPSLASAQQSAQKRDPRKPSTAYSYLPLSDPGSTYSGIMHGTLIGHEEPRSKRSRNDKGATGRAQRASARNQTAMTVAAEPTSSTEPAACSVLQPIVLDAEPSGSATGDEDATLSRSNSSSNLHDAAQLDTATKGRRKDKGKGKEVGTPPARVKEEQSAVAVPTQEPLSNLLNNNDHCSSCRSNGALVYCDGCPRAFHLWCLDPPMENIDEGDSRWFCPGCLTQKHPPRRPPPSLLSPLIYQVETSIPVEFQLPDDIRNFFRDVTTGPKGTYVDATEVKPPRLNRHGLLEDRDPHRLRDKNGAAVLCFRCGMSALPTGLASNVPTAKRPRRAASKASTPDTWKSILSCDYCDLHWHLDCLDPPLSAMPPFNKKWMCPNHAERVLHPQRRIPRNNATPIEISKPRQWNNGNIEISQSEPPAALLKPRVQVDEVLINGRRYRVPERIVILDFWSKLNRHGAEEHRDMDTVSALSSPLTSLSSLDDLDDPMDGNSLRENRDMQAAQLLFDFSSTSRSTSKSTAERSAPPTKFKTNGAAASSSSGVAKKASAGKISRVVSTSTNGTSAASPTISSRPSRSAKKVATLRIANNITDLNGIGESSALSTEEPATEEAPKRRQRAPKKPQAEKKVTQSAGARDLRSRSRNTTQDSVSSVSITDHKHGPVLRLTVDDSQHAEGSSTASGTGKKFRAVFVKREEVETPISFATSGSEQPSNSNVSQATPKRRQSRRVKSTEEVPKLDEKETKEKRGRKRKTREEEVPEPVSKKTTATVSGKRSRKDKTDGVEAGAKEKRKLIASPLKPAGSTSTNETTPDSVSAPVPPRPPTTPSLKIRLPVRLNSASKPAISSVANGKADTPTRL
ncbi:hypothetical protein DFP72DRAFT_1029512 [Ephemerocybe angulata]|uniref:PHD-type domain-containing protein n=1 Tax=Ephemerocybe angulata TaxID=980116 RepID=A0A8H6IIS6_9AGAR|nr:hypothetical protein DFP72DRAFT_1029512 [Tulosesus angulatus]